MGIKHKLGKKETRDRHKNAEQIKAKEHWPVFISELNKAAKKSVGEQRHVAHMEAHQAIKDERNNLTDQDRRAWMEENKPKKFTVMARQLEYQKSDCERLGDPDVHYEGDIRITMITSKVPGQIRKLRKALDITGEEASMILEHQDQFPNIRFVYDFWANKTTVKWDRG